MPTNTQAPHRSGAVAARDLLLAELADRQWGLVQHLQLVALGFDQAAITRRLRSGRLRRIHVGVYVVGHLALRTEGRLLGAVWACGPRSALSHRSAGQLSDIRACNRELIEVTVACSGRRSRRGLQVHVTSRLAAHEVTVIRGIPVTTPARTIADLAAVLGYEDLARTVERADALGVLDVRALLASASGRPGATALRSILVAQMEPAGDRSELERRLLAVVARAGIREPERNVLLHGFETDLVWRAERLAVEADGRAFHIARAAFERDRSRDALFAAHGWRVLRFTWRQVTRRPGEVTRALEAALGPAREAA